MKGQKIGMTKFFQTKKTFSWLPKLTTFCLCARLHEYKHKDEIKKFHIVDSLS